MVAAVAAIATLAVLVVVLFVLGKLHGVILLQLEVYDQLPDGTAVHCQVSLLVTSFSGISTSCHAA